MRQLVLFAALLVLSTSCGKGTPGPQGPEGPQGPAGPAGFSQGPSLSLAEPRVVVQGTTLDVSLVGFATTWTRAARADFGSGITVNSTTLGSATSLIVNITVPLSVTPGSRDITVTEGMQSVTLHGFEVQTPVSFRVDGRPAQGGVVRVVATVRDTKLALTPESLTLSLSPAMGVHSLPGNFSVQGSTVVAWLGIDADAMPGPRSVLLTIETPTGADLTFDAPALFDVQMRGATQTTFAMPEPLSFDRSFDSALLAFTPPMGTLDSSLTVTSDVDAGRPQLALLEADGRFGDKTTFVNTLYIDFTALDGGTAYIAVVDPASSANSLTVKPAPPFMEMEPNDTAATANVIGAPGLFTANLSDVMDPDWFVIRGSPALAGRRITVLVTGLVTDMDLTFDLRQSNMSITGGIVDNGFADDPETATVTIPGSGDLLLFVKSYSGSSTPVGDYTVKITLQ